MREVVERGLGLSWQIDADPYDLGVDALAGLALRDNPRRAQLVVSRVLGKHLPVVPGVARAAGLLLAARVGDALGLPGPPLDGGLRTVAGRVDDVPRRVGAPVVLGFCETATALGHLVAEAFSDAHYVHTTRRPEPGLPVVAGFDEEHSHAVEHALQLRRPEVLDDPARPLVLVDDELTTGRTALNTLEALHARWPRRHYVVAALLDLRSAGAREAFRRRAEKLAARVDVVSLLDGELRVPADVDQRATALRRALAQVPAAAIPTGLGRVSTVAGAWPAGLPLGGRTGVSHCAAQLEAVGALAVTVAPGLSGGPVLVLGTEELMWLPLRLAGLLPAALFQSTTRSPVLPADLPGYAVRRAVLFPSPDEPSRTSRLHGLPEEPYADVVVVTDTPASCALPLAEALRPWASSCVHVVAL